MVFFKRNNLIKSVFERIAAKNEWNLKQPAESISGPGSYIETNKYRVIFLHKFINDYKITDIIDICGDCNWQHTIPELDKVNYFGIDASKTALCEAKEKNKSRPYMKFAKKPMDLTRKFPKVNNGHKTLLILKEVIQHLTQEQGLALLRRAKDSGIKYIAITNHDQNLFNVKQNDNIQTGEFYPNNVFLPPFNFKNPLRDIADELDHDLQAKYGNLIIFDLSKQSF